MHSIRPPRNRRARVGAVTRSVQQPPDDMVAENRSTRMSGQAGMPNGDDHRNVSCRQGAGPYKARPGGLRGRSASAGCESTLGTCRRNHVGCLLVPGLHRLRLAADE